MAYQKCPVCNGTRYMETTHKTIIDCKTCDGSGIINELTGLPPKKQNKKIINKDG